MFTTFHCNNGLFFVLTLSSACTLFSSSEIHDSLQKNGFLEIENCELLRSNYKTLYQQYDQFIDLMDTDKNFFEAVSHSEKEFVVDSGNRVRYCAAPPSYRNPSVHAKKINNRIYFQYIKEHFDFIKEKCPTIVQKSGDFLNQMALVDRTSKKYFAKIITSLEAQCPGISKVFYGDNEELRVVTKIVRYKKTQDWHEKPHFDKSGLTIIWDNDDNHQSLMLCKDTKNPTKAGLELPVRSFAGSVYATSALLIGGLCLKTLNYDIRPTLHYVGPIKNEYRHSIISFLLVPGIDTSALQTEFIEG